MDKLYTVVITILRNGSTESIELDNCTYAEVEHVDDTFLRCLVNHKTFKISLDDEAIIIPYELLTSTFIKTLNNQNDNIAL